MRAAVFHTYDPNLCRSGFVIRQEVPEPRIETPRAALFRVAGAGARRTGLQPNDANAAPHELTDGTVKGRVELRREYLP